jgi:hypothetical protein
MPYSDFIPVGVVPSGGEGDGFKDFVPAPTEKIDEITQEEITTVPDKKTLGIDIDNLSEEDLADMGITKEDLE